MSLFDTVRRVFSKSQIKLPSNLDSVQEAKARARQLASQHSGQIDSAAERLKQALPDDRADKAVDAARDKLDDFAQKQ